VTERNRRRRRTGRARLANDAAGLLAEADASLLDIVDNLLNKGVVLNGEIILAIADVDLVYMRLSALLCAADRVLPEARGRRNGRPARLLSGVI
jgi:hypothetical protein